MFLRVLVVYSLIENNIMENISKLNIVGWNIHCSFASSQAYMNELMKSNDVIVISEHALYPCEHYKFNDVNLNFEFNPVKSYAKLNDLNFGSQRGQGGIAIGWKKCLSNMITPLNCSTCDRICAIQVNGKNSVFFIVAVYMPHSSCIIASFKAVLEELENVIIDLMPKGDVCIIGDINCHFSQQLGGSRGWGRSSVNSKQFMRFAQQYNLTAVDMSAKTSGPTYTYTSPLGYHSYIDHVFASSELSYSMVCQVVPDSANNPSDHLPIRAEIELHGSVATNVGIPRRQVAWHKASRGQIMKCYTEPLGTSVNNVCLDNEMDLLDQDPVSYKISEDKIERMVEQFSQILKHQSHKLPHKEYNAKLKPYWTRGLTDLTSENKRIRRLWIEAGRPEDPLHPAKIAYKQAKCNFRREQRRLRHEYEIKSLESLAASQEIDQKHFWYLVNKSRKKYCSVNPIRNEEGEILTDIQDIRNNWNDYYKRLLNEYDGEIDMEFKNRVEKTVNTINQADDNAEFLKGGKITDDEIKKHVMKMKSNRAPGWDEITTEHIRYGGSAIYCMVAWLLNAICVSEYMPEYFKKGLIVSIPKGHKDHLVKGNHRGITLMPVLYKILENIFVERERGYFDNMTHELQGANHKNCSSLHTSMIVQEAIEYNTRKGGNVWVAFLDIRKAFDTVWIPGMLYKLYETGIDAKIWRLIQKGYTNFLCAAYVAGEPGDWFIQTRGLHQGAPISMMIYQVYINDLIKELCSSMYAVKVGRVNVTAPTFADDLSAIACHEFGMNQLLVKAKQYSIKWQFDYGIAKCVLSIWGSLPHPPAIPHLGEQKLSLVQRTKHMGIELNSTKKLDLEDANKRVAAAQGVVLSARGIGSYMTPVTPTILSKIYWSVGVSKMAYGLEVKPMHENEINVLEKAHRKFAKIIQGLPDNTANCTPVATLGWLCMSSYIAMRKIIFLWHLIFLPETNIYRRIMMHIIACVGPRVPDFSKSPVKEMYRMAWRYGLGLDVWEALLHGPTGTFMIKKRATKQLVWDFEKRLWRSTTVMFKNLDYYLNTIDDIKVLSWWKFVRKKPAKIRQTSCTVALLLGTQPKGMQCNYSGICVLCNERQQETPEHVLLRCRHYDDVRPHYVNRINSCMPLAMQRQFGSMTMSEQCQFLLSGLNNSYIEEWNSLYTEVVDFVWHMYRYRHQTYGNA